MLLKALRVTTDPKELKKMIGVRTVAEVYRTLDKLALRKEYHQALAKHGVSFDFIVEELRSLVKNGNDKVRLGALQTLLKSVGMDKYEAVDDGSGGTWEETLLKAIEKDNPNDSKLLLSGDNEFEEYEVTQPIIPDSIRKMQEEEQRYAKGIYD